MNTVRPVAIEGVHQLGIRRLKEAIVIAAAPATLAVLEVFHPHPGNLLALDVRTWMIVHYIQVPLFALSALAVARLVGKRAGPFARLSRLALFVFALCFVVFDTAAGLVVGSLVEAARASGAPGTWQTPIETVWTDPVLGGTNRPLLAVVGRVALSAGTVAAAVSLWRAGRPWLPVLLLALSGCVMYVFPSHSWPGGPLTFGAMAMAAAWLQWAAPTSSSHAPVGGQRGRAGKRPRPVWLARRRRQTGPRSRAGVGRAGAGRG